MSVSTIDPHEKMRGRDVGRVARGEQASRPPHEPGSISEAPPAPTDGRIQVALKTAPADIRFPSTNQTRHCFARYMEYHRCIREKGDEAPECEKFARSYRSLCPSEWIDKWNEQRELGTFAGPL